MPTTDERTAETSPSNSVTCSTFTGYVVTKHCYSGEVRYSEQCWTDKEAAAFRLGFVRALCGEWEEAKMKAMEFELIDDRRAMGVKDRKVYSIRRDTRDELHRAAILAKLTDEEKRVLGV